MAGHFNAIALKLGESLLHVKVDAFASKRHDPVMGHPSDATVLAWARLVRAHTFALGTVEGALKEASLPALEWYDVLLELERAGPLRPRDLQAHLLLAQSNLSRLLCRMELAGVIERRLCLDDRRGQVVAVSKAGRSLRRRMWPAYADAIQKAIGANLNDGEAESLAALLLGLSRDA